MRPMAEHLDSLLREIRACRACEDSLQHGARPILRASKSAQLLIVSQAPGVRAHDTRLSFNDPSGDRLREWLGINRDTFYDESRVAIIGMAFCFPGYNAQGHDKPPRKECALLWQGRLMAALPNFPLILLVGSYAQNWHLKERAKENMTKTVSAWREYIPRFLPLPHPSWRNNAWVKRHPWFETDLLPYLRRRVRRILGA